MIQVFLDTETTGVENGACVIELAAIMVEDGEIIDTFHEYCKPYRPINPKAYEAHHISMDFLKDKPEEKKILDKFIEWFKYTAKVDEVLAYNAQFDIRIINDRCIADFLMTDKLFDDYRITDVAKLSRQAIKNGLLGNVPPSRKWNQTYVASLIGLSYEAHSALEDVKAMKQIYDELISRGVMNG